MDDEADVPEKKLDANKENELAPLIQNSSIVYALVY